MNRILVSDVDGILTDGGHYYTAEGKFMKKIGSNEKDALKLLLNHFDTINFISADKYGFDISKKRISFEWGYQLDLITTAERENYLKSLKGEVYFLGDGIHDANCKSVCYKFLTLLDSTPQAKNAADFVLPTTAGKNVFANLLFYIKEIL